MGLPTASRTGPPKGDGAYVLSSVTETSSEQERLDEMHTGVTGFLGGELTFADLGNPKRILEVGAGIGAWAIHAAKDYPDAEIIAIDVAPLPERVLPKNVKFMQMDVCQPLPFEHESFDVVHTRFVLMHLPHYRDTLSRICALVKPGGRLLLEEIDARTYSEYRETPEEVTFFYDRLYDWVSAKGVTYDVGSELQPFLSKLGMFIDVTVKVLAVPFSPGWEGPAEVGALGNTMKQSLLKSAATLVKVVPGLTEESVANFRLALEEPENNLRLRIYFLAARKSYRLSEIQNTEVARKTSLLPTRLAQRLFSACLPSNWTGRGLTGAASWFISLLGWR